MTVEYAQEDNQTAVINNGPCLQVTGEQERSGNLISDGLGLIFTEPTGVNKSKPIFVVVDTAEGVESNRVNSGDMLGETGNTCSRGDQLADTMAETYLDFTKFEDTSESNTSENSEPEQFGKQTEELGSTQTTPPNNLNEHATERNNDTITINNNKPMPSSVDVQAAGDVRVQEPEGLDDEQIVIKLASALVSMSQAPFVAIPVKKEQEKQVYEAEKENTTTADGKVRAYAKLQGPNWTFYIQKPTLTMGRAQSQAKQFCLGDKDTFPVDFHLSSADSLSRNHLRIDYNGRKNRWEMSCMGKSGVTVDKRRYESFCPPIPLHSGSVITVANATFSFYLPPDQAVMVLSSSSGSSQVTSSQENSPRKRSIDDLEADEDLLDDPSGSIEDTASQIGVGEYSKPPQSYANLIAEAINSTPNHRMTLSCIYQYLADKYPYFRHTKNGWQNSVRHNLSLNKAFKKVPRAMDEPGKGMLWIIDPDYKHLVDGSVGRRATIRSRTPEGAITGLSAVPRQQLTFIHHMYPGGASGGMVNNLNSHVVGYNNNNNNNQQQQRPAPILPAPEVQLRPLQLVQPHHDHPQHNHQHHPHMVTQPQPDRTQ